MTRTAAVAIILVNLSILVCNDHTNSVSSATAKSVSQVVPTEKGKKAASGQLQIIGDTYLVVKKLPFKIVGPALTKKSICLWSVPEAVKATADDNVLTVTAASKGVHKVNFILIKNENDELTKETMSVEFVVGDLPPTPDPKPDPVPPKPLTGLRALIMVESIDNASNEELHILNSLKVRNILDKKCADGKKGWRKWDKDTNMEKDSPVLAQLWKDSKDKVKLPAVILASDQNATIYPLPATEKEMLDLLEKWGTK